MTASFDWERYEKGKPRSSGKTDFNWDKFEKPKLKRLDKGSQLGTQVGIGALEAGALPYEVATMPLASESAQHGEYRKNVFEDIERLMEQKQTGVWDEQDEQLLQSLTSQIKNPEEAKQFVKTADIGVGSLIEKGTEQLGYDIKPEGLLEHGARIAGNLRSPKQLFNLAKNAPKHLKGIINKEARAALKDEKNWKRLEMVAKSDPEKQTLLKLAKDTKLSPEATNLLFQSEGKADYLARVAKKTPKLQGAVKELNEKLGKNYEELKALGKEGGYLNLQEADTLIGDLEKTLGEIKDTTIIGPESKPIVTMLDDAVQKSMNQGLTVKSLINSQKGLNEGINWNNITKGDYYKNQIKDIYMKAIESKNPAIAERLKDTDKAWAKYTKYKDVLDKRLPTFKFKGVEIPKKYLAPTIFLASLPFGFGKATAVAFAGKEVFQRAMTQIAINPKYNKPWSRMKDAMLKGDAETVKKSFLVLRTLMKEEDPDLYKEMKEFEID